MTTDQILLGVGLIVVLAAGSQVVANLLHIPALIIMLPAGFVAGALTNDVDPQRLLGPAFQPLVSLAVALILYDSGLGLDRARIRGHARNVVRRLVIVGVPITMAFAAVFAGLLFGMSRGAAVMTGAILVVSGPTVVGPLLAFVRPTDRLQQILSWEGSLIDPIGGILGAVVFHAVVAGNSEGVGHAFGQFFVAIGIGVAGAVVGVALLWVCLCKLDLDEILSATTQLACVVAVAAVCDVFRDDAGLIAAILMGVIAANVPAFNIPARRPVSETLVQLMIGLLFVSISATVTPASVRDVVLPTLALVAVLVVITRPLVAFLSTIKTDLAPGERAFIGWMDPRGIVAAATASTFGTQLVARHIGGASKILPVTFLVIVLTVALYGLTALPVARRLGVSNPPSAKPLLIGGSAWVIDLARTLDTCGVEVFMWASSDEERASIRAASLELLPGELIASVIEPGAELEGFTAILLLTDEDDFNALAAIMFARSPDTPVYRLGARNESHTVVAPDRAGEKLFAPALTRPALTARYNAGARITTTQANGSLPRGTDVLFQITADGSVHPATSAHPRAPEPGDTLILLTDKAGAPSHAIDA